MHCTSQALCVSSQIFRGSLHRGVDGLLAGMLILASKLAQKLIGCIWVRKGFIYLLSCISHEVFTTCRCAGGATSQHGPQLIKNPFGKLQWLMRRGFGALEVDGPTRLDFLEIFSGPLGIEGGYRV